MKLLIALQESEAYNVEYNIMWDITLGYTISKYLPLIATIAMAYLIYRLIKKKSKK